MSKVNVGAVAPPGRSSGSRPRPVDGTISGPTHPIRGRGGGVITISVRDHGLHRRHWRLSTREGLHRRAERQGDPVSYEVAVACLVDGVPTTIVSTFGNKEATAIWFTFWIDGSGRARQVEMDAPASS